MYFLIFVVDLLNTTPLVFLMELQAKASSVGPCKMVLSRTYCLIRGPIWAKWRSQSLFPSLGSVKFHTTSAPNTAPSLPHNAKTILFAKWLPKSLHPKISVTCPFLLNTSGWTCWVMAALTQSESIINLKKKMQQNGYNNMLVTVCSFVTAHSLWVTARTSDDICSATRPESWRGTHSNK